MKTGGAVEVPAGFKVAAPLLRRTPRCFGERLKTSLFFVIPFSFFFYDFFLFCFFKLHTEVKVEGRGASVWTVGGYKS